MMMLTRGSDMRSASCTTAKFRRPCRLRVLVVSKHLAGQGRNLARGDVRGVFRSDYAVIAAISGWMPMVFIARVRL